MRRLIGLSVVIVVVAIACGVPGPGEMESIDPQDVPFELEIASTTSTTSTTTTTTTTIPLPTTTEVPIETTTSTIALTTTTAAATESVELYFASGDSLFPISVSVAANADANLILAALLKGPEAYPGVGTGLRSAIPETVVPTVAVSSGVARVDIPAFVFDEMTNDNLVLMFGQIVLTLLSPRCLGQVQFTFDGEDQPVYLGDSLVSEAGQKLSCVDYRQLLSSDSIPSTTTTSAPASTTPPATSVAPVETSVVP